MRLSEQYWFNAPYIEPDITKHFTPCMTFEIMPGGPNVIPIS